MNQIEGGYATGGDFYCCSLDWIGLVWFELDWFGLFVEGMGCFSLFLVARLMLSWKELVRIVGTLTLEPLGKFWSSDLSTKSTLNLDQIVEGFV